MFIQKNFTSFKVLKHGKTLIKLKALLEDNKNLY